MTALTSDAPPLMTATRNRHASHFSKHLVLATLVGLALRLFLVWRFPAEAGDTAMYEELASNWLYHHVYGVFLGGQLTPVDLRPPGYPAFLAAVYGVAGRYGAAARLPVMLAQAALDVVTCFLTAALAACLAPQTQRRRVAVAALWLAATCPFVANYAAVPLTEVLATFLTTLALLVFLLPEQEPSASIANRASTIPISRWLLGGLLVGLGALVRPEAPLLLAAVALVELLRCRRRADVRKLLRAGALMAVGLLMPLVPWAARNWRTLHHVQFLAPRYTELPGEYVPRGFYAWTKTWLVRFRDVYLTVWKLEEEPIRVEDLPDAAFDSAEERARVAALLEQYNATLNLSLEADRGFAELARERTARHPLRTYVWVPLGRGGTMWFTPRVELLPYSGHLWPPARWWEEDPVDFSVTAGFGLLNLFYAGLAVVGAWRWRHRPALALPAAFLLVRTAFLTQVEAPEPRYVLVCFPALLAMAALAWAEPSP